MFWWSAARKKRRLLGLKDIRINGMRFTIRRVNPLMDFPASQVPQLFTESPIYAKVDASKSFTPLQAENMRQTILSFIQAGVVEPKLVPIGKGDQRGKEPGITSEDLFRDPDMGIRLYFEILHNSLNVFSGIKGVFFSIKKKLWLFMHLRLSTAVNQWMSYPQERKRQSSSASSSTSSC